MAVLIIHQNYYSVLPIYSQNCLIISTRDQGKYQIHANEHIFLTQKAVEKFIKIYNKNIKSIDQLIAEYNYKPFCIDITENVDTDEIYTTCKINQHMEGIYVQCKEPEPEYKSQVNNSKNSGKKGGTKSKRISSSTEGKSS